MSKNIKILLLILFLASFLRLYDLGKVPPGFANDEAAITYQAYSILKTGKDTWNKEYPLFTFKDFGEYLPVFSVYAQIPFIKLLGLNEFAARIPFALTGILSTLVVYLLTFELFKKKEIALLSGFLFAVSPLNIGWSRFVYEGNFGSLFYLLGIYFYVKSQTINKFYPLSILFFGLTYATYHIYYLVTSTMLLILFLPKFSFFLKNKKIFINTLVVGLIVAVYASLTVLSGAGRERFRQVSIFSKATVIQNINSNRTGCDASLPGALCRIFYNKPIAYLSEYSFNYFSHLSPQFLALNGTFLRQTILPNHGLIYPFELAFLYFAMAFLIFKRNFASFILLPWFALYPAANSFTGLGEISRIAHATPLFAILSSLGIYQFFLFIKKYKYKKVIMASIIAIATFNITSFLLTYFFVFPKTNSHYGSFAYVELFKKLTAESANYENIYISRDYMGYSPEFQARIFLKMDPEVFQNGQKHQLEFIKPQNYVVYNRLENYYFFHNIEEIDPSSKDLVVVGRNQKTENMNPVFEIKEPSGEISLYGILGISDKDL